MTCPRGRAPASRLPWSWLLGLLALWLLLAPALSRASEDFLAPEKAFRFSARAADARTLELRFDVAPGYYMYREQFRFEASGVDGAPVTLGTADIPAGKVKFDETFKKEVETHRGTLTIRLPVEQAGGPFKLGVTSQGCADQGICYPPMQSHAEVQLAAFGAATDRVAVLSESEAERWRGPGGVLSRWFSSTPNASAAAQSAPALPAAAAPQDAGGPGDAAAGGGVGDRIDAALQSGNLLLVAAVFFVAGLLLSLTPCVLPMLPILSSLIAGQEAPAASQRSRGLTLALAYSLGMALVYTAFGVAAGLVGEGLAAWLQTPWVLGAFAALLVLLALSMFGFYELQLPAALRERLAHAAGRSRGGSLLGVFAMGGISALIVSPCVAAPLAGALLYISQTRDVLLGGGALFSLAWGMSVPLLLLGASAGRWLPRAGGWMEHVKHFFGALLIAVALWLLQPVLPGALAMLLWGALLLIGAVYLRVFDPLHAGARGWARFFKGVGVVLAMLGGLQLVGAASGGSDPWQPLRHFARSSAAGAISPEAAADDAALRFRPVASNAELDALLRSAGRPVMLDFYADWCVSCKEMEAFTFSDPRVRELMSGALLLKADVTANDAEHRALLKRFRLFGPPGIIFFDAQGRELPGVRVIGFQSADRFLQSLQAAGL
ncbi:protein-disulfide reductase DsbD [Caldimonas tepidiphila]|uniref:protein-disulfide reductase DsbD n=1 Tax=Caldimonas tepidiphila TaxID=2315841 RepID=UPI000E5A28F9|nr:protein-disulfide reductase DsbD [Caldimonas tepidiphila]